jgi:hypothetical protein
MIIKLLLPTGVKKKMNKLVKMKVYESMNTVNAQRKKLLKLEKKFLNILLIL